MILLKEIHFPQCIGELLTLDGETAGHKIALAPIMDAGYALGLQQIQLEHPDGSREGFVLTPTPTHGLPVDRAGAVSESATEQRGLETLLLDHQWCFEDNRLVYDARFSHEKAALPFMTAYFSLLLAAVGVRDAQILQFRLAMYELCANAVEHGIVLQTPPEIGIHLALTPGEVSGWIQDGCEHFDPTAQPVGSLRERAESRASRGYGIHMMHQLLEQFRHEFNTTGNRIHFRKRFGR